MKLVNPHNNYATFSFANAPNISGLRELWNLGATDLGNAAATIANPSKIKQIWGNRTNRFNQLNGRSELRAQSRLTNRGQVPSSIGRPTGEGMTSPTQLKGRMLDDPMMDMGRRETYGEKLSLEEQDALANKENLWSRLMNQYRA